MYTTSQTLLVRLRQPNNNEAWKRFVELYTPLLYSWLCRCGMKREDTADVIQDVFTVLAQKMPKFEYDKQKSFRAWLKTITLNKWRDRCKSAGTVPADRTLDQLAAPDNVELFVDDEYRRHMVRQAMQLMAADFNPSTWKACWEMTVNGRSAQDVAGDLGLTVKAVYSANYRVLCRLREELEGLLD